MILAPDTAARCIMLTDPTPDQLMLLEALSVQVQAALSGYCGHDDLEQYILDDQDSRLSVETRLGAARYCILQVVRQEFFRLTDGRINVKSDTFRDATTTYDIDPDLPSQVKIFIAPFMNIPPG